MKFSKMIPAFLSVLFLAVSIVYVADRQQETEQNDTVTEATKSTEEIRGVWVTYMTLDVENETDREAAFKRKIDAVIEDMQRANLNTMVVQVRPFADAIYPSRYYPWSHILSGRQGEDPGFDPLQYIIEAAHGNGIWVHAWINPYRVSTQNTPATLSDDNPYVKDPTLGVEVNGSIYLNPASKSARELIVNGAVEIVENYEIDGVQLDDYFYPPDCGDFDKADYEAYVSATDTPLSLADYRKDNVNQLIAAIYEAVHKTNRNILFGVSPQGNISNNDGIYADVKLWCAAEGYIDYICPQIYFSLDNPAMTFEDGLADWLRIEQHRNLALYIGIPAYKAGTDADDGTWLDSSDILKTEIEISREKGADGFMLYSYDSFTGTENAAEIQNVMRYLTDSSAN